MSSGFSLKNEMLKEVCEVLLPELERAYKSEAILSSMGRTEEIGKHSVPVHSKIIELLHKLDLSLGDKYPVGFL